MVEDALLGKRMEIKGVREGLDELQLELEPGAVGGPRVVRGLLGLGHGGHGRSHGGAAPTNVEGGCLAHKPMPNKASRFRLAWPSHDVHDASDVRRRWRSRVLLPSTTFTPSLRGTIMSGDDEHSGWQLTESDPGVFT